jgi:hypothetical protein
VLRIFDGMRLINVLDIKVQITFHTFRTVLSPYTSVR